MPGIVNQTLLQRYEKLAKELYTEPKNEEILGTFLHPVIRDVHADEVGWGKRKKTNKTSTSSKRKTTEVRCADIRKLFI